MIRRKSSRLSGRTSKVVDEDVNPNSYLTNLSDCMLVMAVGLLVALVSHYGVDLQKSEQTITGTEVVMDVNQDGRIDNNFQEAGSVYYDSSTGNYYMVPK